VVAGVKSPNWCLHRWEGEKVTPRRQELHDPNRETPGAAGNWTRQVLHRIIREAGEPLNTSDISL